MEAMSGFIEDFGHFNVVRRWPDQGSSDKGARVRDELGRPRLHGTKHELGVVTESGGLKANVVSGLISQESLPHRSRFS